MKLAAAVFIQLALAIRVCQSIVLDRIGIPPYAVQGKEAVLSCEFNLEGQALYSVKWYKNGQEFYRYLPGSKDLPMTVYARPGVNVDRLRSNATQVTLTDLILASTGRYRCEVSTEAPSFATVSHFGDLIVVVVPSSGPTITGGKPRYLPGDEVNLTCTSKESKPAADLMWFVNGDKADDSRLFSYPIVNTSRDLHTSSLGLRFKVSKEDFDEDGDLKLKCTAKISSIYWQSNEKSAEGIKKRRRAGNYEKDGSLSIPGLSSAFGSSSSSTATPGTANLASLVFAYILVSKIILPAEATTQQQD